MRLLAGELEGRGLDVELVRLPGATALGERVRGLVKDRELAPVAEADVLLQVASTAQAVHEVIGPALERGAVVVCDRYVDSTFAYQGFGRGVDVSELVRLHRWACGWLMPDLTVLLDADAELLARRRGGAGLDRYEALGVEFYARVVRGYRAAERSWPWRVRKVDALGSIDDVHAAVVGLVDDVLSRRLTGCDTSGR